MIEQTYTWLTLGTMGNVGEQVHRVLCALGKQWMTNKVFLVRLGSTDISWIHSHLRASINRTVVNLNDRH